MPRSRTLTVTLLLVAAVLALTGGAGGVMPDRDRREPDRPSQSQGGSLRTIEFEATEVTDPDVAVSPDGHWLIFTMLGHLFRVPVAGGVAEQLTFGPYYHSDPVFSPDGRHVAFVSDRDASEGNIFVLDFQTRKVIQLTRELWAARPAWSPDGRGVVYLRMFHDGAGLVPRPDHSIPETLTAAVRRVVLAGGEPQTLSSRPRVIGAVFYLPDGRVGWAAIELAIDREAGAPRATTRLEAVDASGRVSVLRTLPGYAAPVIVSPDGRGLYARRFLPALPWFNRPLEELIYVPLDGAPERRVVPTTRPRGWVARPAISADNRTLFVGDGGRLWKIDLRSDARGGDWEPVPFKARAKMEVHPPTPPAHARIVSAGSARPRTILDPRLSPDGKTLVFGAAGYLWIQSLDGQPARRLVQSQAFEREPAFSPDGHRLAFIRTQGWNSEVCIFDFRDRQARTLASGSRLWNLSWSPDGKRVLFVEAAGSTPRAVTVEVTDGRRESLRELEWLWFSRPHLSSDGRILYFSGPPDPGTLHRMALGTRGEPEPLTRFDRMFGWALVSPDGQSVAFRRQMEIWVARLGQAPVEEKDLRQLSPHGGDTFTWTPDGSSVLYAVGNHVWRQPLDGRPREEIPIRLSLERVVPPPVVLQRVRVLDFASGRFGPETSMLLERGRIRRLGTRADRDMPRDAIVLDAAGRFGIPGLFDMHAHVASFPGERRQAILQEALLAYGITSVRDPSSALTLAGALADRAETGSDPVPRSFFSGETFHGAGPGEEVSQHLPIRAEDDAHRYVRLWTERGAHFLKVYYPLPWTLHRAVAEEARRQGLPIAGHGAWAEEIVKSVTLGYASLEHTTTPSRLYDDILQLLAAAGTRWVPTLGRRGGNALLLVDEPDRLADPKLRAYLRITDVSSEFAGIGLFAAVGLNELRGRWALQLASLRDAYRRGVKLHVGTDGAYGPSLHWELEYFVEAGLSPLEVLRLATQRAAEAVGAHDDLGTLEPGKLADLVLLDANPLADIRNIRTIWRVIRGGWVFDPEKLRPPAFTSTIKQSRPQDRDEKPTAIRGG